MKPTFTKAEGRHVWEGNLPFRDPLNRDRRFLPLRLDAASIKEP